jgi:DNA processing protein
MEISSLNLNILRLKFIDTIGNQTIRKIIDSTAASELRELKLEDYSSLLTPKQKEAVINSPREKNETNINLIRSKLEKNEFKLLNIWDADYPEALKQIYDAPVLLFVKGNLDYNYKRSIGIVGTRRFTNYGEKQCREFVKAFGNIKMTIVSGLAYGIDSIAHLEALKVGSKCIAVIGSGFDFFYPPRNQKLFDQIVESGGAVITEYPPNFVALPQNFPARNRIIAGLSRSTFVVEAAVKSGSLITAKFAFDEGRDVFALPADITRKGSDGCNHLIKNGIAKLVMSPEDIFLEYDIGSKVTAKEINKIEFENEEHEYIYKILIEESFFSDEIAVKLDKQIEELNPILTEMELYGLIKKEVDGRWIVE